MHFCRMVNLLRELDGPRFKFPLLRTELSWLDPVLRTLRSSSKFDGDIFDLTLAVQEQHEVRHLRESSTEFST